MMQSLLHELIAIFSPPSDDSDHGFSVYQIVFFQFRQQGSLNSNLEWVTPSSEGPVDHVIVVCCCDECLVCISGVYAWSVLVKDAHKVFDNLPS